MAIKLVNVKLKDGVDQNSFVSEFDSVSEVTVKNLLPNIPTLVVFNVEESYLSTLQSHSSVEVAEEEPESFTAVTYPSQPSAYTISNKTIAPNVIGASDDGTDYLSYQHYLDTDLMQKDGNNDLGYALDYNDTSTGFADRTTFDEIYEYTGQTYSSRYTGKHVDIITIEGGGGITGTTYQGYQDNHPDFDDPDNTGNTRCVPMDWNGCSYTTNNQVTSNNMFTAHGIGSLSAAGGIHSGFAKKSKLYAIYKIEGIATVCNAIIHFHNNKSTNGTTGLKDPTIVIGEYQYLRDTYTGIKITDIASVTDPTGGTTNRPDSGWGSDFTAFTSRNIFPYRVQDPDDDSWHWMVTFPEQTQSSADKTALDSLHTNGIIFINAAGNNGGTFVKESDTRWSGTYCTMDSGGVDKYDIRWYTGVDQTMGVSSPNNTNTVTWYPFRSYGPHGLDKGIDVAAGANSESQPMLDDYSTRGPGIDIVGRGAYTFSAYPQSTDTNGYKWGNFSGTSCATPTVVGKAACMMEEYYTLNGAWPNFTQVKNMLQTEARNGNNRVLDPASTTWSNVPTASGDKIQSTSQLFYPYDTSLLRIPKSGASANGSITFAELAGTPNFFAFWNARAYSREQTMHKRPTTGVMYPRPRNISNIE